MLVFFCLCTKVNSVPTSNRQVMIIPNRLLTKPSCENKNPKRQCYAYFYASDTQYQGPTTKNHPFFFSSIQPLKTRLDIPIKASTALFAACCC